MEIEKIVTTKYKVDGILFDTYEQAERWKAYVEEQCKKNGTVKMWNLDGEETDEMDCAAVIYLEGDYSAQAFINRANDEGDITNADGINCGDEGYFYWEKDKCEYIRVNPDIVDLLHKVIR